MNEKNRFPGLGDVSREVNEILEGAMPALELTVGSLKKVIANSQQRLEDGISISKDWVEGGVADSRKLAENSVEKVNDIASISVKLGKTTLARLISNVPVLGDRFTRDEE